MKKIKNNNKKLSNNKILENILKVANKITLNDLNNSKLFNNGINKNKEKVEILKKTPKTTPKTTPKKTPKKTPKTTPKKNIK